MITPNKAVPLKDSMVYKMVSILDSDFKEIRLIDLYRSTKKKFSGIEEFMYSLDALYVLGKIEVELESGIVRKC